MFLYIIVVATVLLASCSLQAHLDLDRRNTGNKLTLVDGGQYDFRGTCVAGDTYGGDSLREYMEKMTPSQKSFPVVNMAATTRVSYVSGYRCGNT